MSKNFENDGIELSREKMENGELRTRVMIDGVKNPSAYIIVEVPEDGGGWQNAHYHNKIVETWLVEKGIQIVMEREKSGGIKVIVMKPGDTYTSRLGIEHNCWVAPGSITHTIKINNCDGDWNAAEEFDKYTKSLGESALERYLKE